MEAENAQLEDKVKEEVDEEVEGEVDEDGDEEMEEVGVEEVEEVRRSPRRSLRRRSSKRLGAQDKDEDEDKPKKEAKVVLLQAVEEEEEDDEDDEDDDGEDDADNDKTTTDTTTTTTTQDEPIRTLQPRSVKRSKLEADESDADDAGDAGDDADDDQPDDDAAGDEQSDEESNLGDSRVMIPQWVKHVEAHRLRIVSSLDFDASMDRLCTAGYDGVVKIWNARAILNEDVEADERVHKCLATLTTHEAQVNCARFAHKSLCLASCADDCHVVVSKFQPGRGGTSSFGSNNVENWRTVQLLKEHNMNVLDLAWAKDDRWLASCSLDQQVVVWTTHDWACIQKLSAHSGPVKGVAWDPQGRFLASHGEEGAMCIWRTSDWQLERKVTDGLGSQSYGRTVDQSKVSALESCFSRFSWSPLGTTLAASHGRSQQLYVTQIYERGTWAKRIQYVGHSAPTTVSAFSPVFYCPNSDHTGADVHALCAVASMDGSISLWDSGASRAITVFTNFFDRTVLDIAWFPNGRGFAATSNDCSVIVIYLALEELNLRTVPFDDLPLAMRQRFNSTAADTAGVVDDPVLLQLRKQARDLERQQRQGALRPTTLTSTSSTGDVIHAPLVRRKGSKRKSVQPLSQSSNGALSPLSQRLGGRDTEPLSGRSLSFGEPAAQPPSKRMRLAATLPAAPSSGHVQITVNLSAQERRSSGISEPRLTFAASPVPAAATASLLQCRSADAQDEQLWSAAIACRVVVLAGSSAVFAAFGSDGSMHLFSCHGRLLAPPAFLSAPAVRANCSIVQGAATIAVVSQDGRCSSWKVNVRNLCSPAVLVRDIDCDAAPCLAAELATSPHITLTRLWLHPHNASPCLMFSSGQQYAWNRDSCCWHQLAPPDQSPFAAAQTSAHALFRQLASQDGAQRHLAELNKLETVLASALQQGDATAFRSAARNYAERLAATTSEAPVATPKLKAFITELMGPPRPVLKTQLSNNEWAPHVFPGQPDPVDKRQLLKTLLPGLSLAEGQAAQRVIASAVDALAKINEATANGTHNDEDDDEDMDMDGDDGDTQMEWI